VRRHGTIVTLLLMIGAGVCALGWRPRFDPFTALSLFAATAAFAVPPVRRGTLRALAWLERQRPLALAAGVFLISLIELAHAALSADHYFAPKSHDEHSYALSARMLSAGRLWAPGPEAADSFESFHMITRPVYASIYPPGTGLLHAPGLLLGAPDWWTSVALAALAIAAGFLLLREWVRSDLALVGAMLALGSPELRKQSILIMSQVPSLLLGELTLLAAIHWLRRPGAWRAVGLGLAAGMHLITRPQDAACVLLPVAFLTLPTALRSRSTWARSLVACAAAASPFGALMATQNIGLTGSPFRSGYWAYTQAMQPGTGFLDHSATSRPQTVIPQKIEYNDTFGRQARQEWGRESVVGVEWRRISEAVGGALPSAGFAVLLPLGIARLATGRRTRIALWVAGCFAFVYGTFTFFLPHYVISSSFLIVTMVVAAPLSIRSGRVRRAAISLLGLVALATMIASFPGVNPRAADTQFFPGVLTLADDAERSLPIRPALLLFKFTPGHPLHQEPVYNLRSWDIDAHDVIRAHDLTPELNRKLFESYAHRTPRRYVYRFDRTTATITPLGWVDDLARP
jgi:hypothetical protein